MIVVDRDLVPTLPPNLPRLLTDIFVQLASPPKKLLVRQRKAPRPRDESREGGYDMVMRQARIDRRKHQTRHGVWVEVGSEERRRVVGDGETQAGGDFRWEDYCRPDVRRFVPVNAEK